MTPSPTPTPTIEDLARVIDSAVDALQDHGHNVGANLNRETGALCLNGALMHAAGVRVRKEVALGFYLAPQLNDDAPHRQLCYRTAATVVALHVPTEPDCCREYDAVRLIAHYNDYHCAGREDALLILKKARGSL